METREGNVHEIVLSDDTNDDIDIRQDEGRVTQVEVDPCDKRSKVWNHMTQLTSSDPEKIRAQCNHCSKTFAAKSTNDTCHMLRHVRKCMARRNIDIRTFCIGSKVEPDGNQCMSLRNQFIDHDVLRKSISMFVAGGAHAFSTIEEPGFKYMASCMCPSFSVMSRHTLRRDILKLYDDERKIVEKDLISAPGRIAFTTDNGRNDHTKDEYICITAHWIDSEWKLQKRIIRFGAFSPPFDGINIGDDVSLCLSKWNITNKVACFTLDNATYNNVMIFEIKRQLLRSGNDLLFGGQFFQIRCCCHIINLIVQAGLIVLDGVVDNIRAIISHFKHSIPKKKKFYEVAEQIYHLDPKKASGPALDHVIEKDKDLMQYALSEDEWEKVSNIHKFLKTFYDVTNEFSASKTPTSNVYFKGVWETQRLLLEMVNGPHDYVVDMVKLMQKKFDKYWNEYNLLLSCACVLDPQYKLAFVEYSYTSIYGEVLAKEKANEVLTTLRNLLKEYSHVGKRRNDFNMSNAGASTTIPAGRNERLGSFSSWMRKRQRVEVDKSELDLYLEEKILNYEGELDVLDYWKGMITHFPQLAVMARDVLAVPISFVPLKSAFSMGNKLINPWRASLTSLTIESLACYED